MRQDLNLQGNDFSNIATFLFVGQAVYEIPNGMRLQVLYKIEVQYQQQPVYLVQKFPAAKYLAFNLILCGVATAASAAARNYQTLLVARTFLGCFEGTIPPSLILLSSQWYTKPEQALRFSFWYLGLGAGQILGGCVSFGFQHVPSSAALPPWRIMFVATGLLSVAMGFVIFLFVPDAPMEAGWMSHGEKVALLRHVSVNQTGVANRKFRGKELLEAFRDPQIWLLLLAVILVCFLSLDTVGGILRGWS